ncbi:MAG: YitT family protein [Oscillospiraceae bacterium]|nr:YitT family protein [Oscillospiraceae bacterium]
MFFRKAAAALKTIPWKNFPALTVAGIINAFGITVFLMPVKLYDSGISGTSMLLSQVTPHALSLSLFLLVLNIPLFLFGLRRQGVSFTVCSVYAVAIYSLCAYLITDVLPIDVSFASPLAGKDLLLCALFGGLLSGIGSGLTIRFGGALDGVEVMAVIFAKRIGVSVGTFVMAFNLVLYIAAGFVIRSWILPLYSIVTYAAALKTVDFIVEGIDRGKSAMIITNRPEGVCKALSDSFGSGITVIEAKGYYSDSSKTMVYFVVNRFQIGRLKSIVRENDPSAFIAISEVADVLGSTIQNEPARTDAAAPGSSSEDHSE